MFLISRLMGKFQKLEKSGGNIQTPNSPIWFISSHGARREDQKQTQSRAGNLSPAPKRNASCFSTSDDLAWLRRAQGGKTSDKQVQAGKEMLMVSLDFTAVQSHKIPAFSGFL